MRIKLDDDQWVAAAEATLGDIFAELSERAHAQSRIVTTMMLDHRRITDRDIDPQLLQQPSTCFSDLVATSATQRDIIETARGSMNRYCEHIVQEGNSLVSRLRLDTQDFARLDRWLGQVADVLELMENGPHDPAADSGAQVIAGWLEKLLEARHLRDTVRMADLLEYEILPRLSS
jgi:hypothetical protein